MKVIAITKYGPAEKAFEISERGIPQPGLNDVVVKVDAFGLNYADVMARLGMYADAPPIPSVIGYEVVGRVESTGTEIHDLQKGQRVLAFTRFGGYAEYAITDRRAVVPVPEDMSNGVAAALATQYCTAYYAACEMVNLYPGDHVLVQAAAGGVGTAIVQLAKLKSCIVYGTAGSDGKLEYLRKNGVDYPINYRKQDFYEEIMRIRGEDKLDVVFDSLGGKTHKRARKLLAHGGRIVGYGIAERSNFKGHLPANLRLAWNFGFMHPIGLLMNSRGIIGINLLRIADFRPHIIERCLNNLLKLASNGDIVPHVGGVFNSSQIAQAHNFLESRQSVGKVIVEWK